MKPRILFICQHNSGRSQIAEAYLVPERKLSFSPISASDKNFNPRNTKCIPVVKILVFLDLDKKS